MEEGPWRGQQDGPGGPSPDHVTLLDGTTFCISDRRGDISVDATAGLFVRDTRMLSAWSLTLGNRQLSVLTVHLDAPFDGWFVAEAPFGGIVRRRRQLVVDGFLEQLIVVNTTSGAVATTVVLDVAVDFADLFEVKDRRVHSDRVTGSVAPDGSLEFGALRSGLELGCRVVASPSGQATPNRLVWDLQLEQGEAWRCELVVRATVDALGGGPRRHHRSPEEASAQARRQRFRSAVPRLQTADPVLAGALRQSVEDLGMLRIFDPDRPELPVVAAGAPWFMALFGRDSVLTAQMMLPVDTSLAQGTVRVLAAYQGAGFDHAAEEEPGRILHELRFGPSGTAMLGGRNAYYGTADATPLFVVLMGALDRWSPGVIDDTLLEHADRALEWMESVGDRDGDGFIEYRRPDADGGLAHGLVNQGWKDSWDGINFADGRLAQAPIALAEVQGYAYAAYRARAELAGTRGDQRRADDCGARAEALKARFDEAFWMPERGWYAVALDHEKRQVDALTSNIGHCLWSGIAEPGRAHDVARRLLSEEMFSGWGIRTLATSMSRYSAMSYHNGSVWPHDTALCLSGLARYGFRDEAVRLAEGLLDAAAGFGQRLPEAFSGLPRDFLATPVPYPSACSPQAWAAAAPVEMLSALLGLDTSDETLRCNPVMPDRMLPLVLENVRFRGHLHRLEVTTEGAWIDVR